MIGTSIVQRDCTDLQPWWVNMPAGSGEHHLEFTSKFARDTELTGQWCPSCIFTHELVHVDWKVDANQARRLCRPLAQHICISRHFPGQVPFTPEIWHIQFTIAFTWFNIYYIHSKRQRNLKDLVSVELKGDKSTEGCQTLENSRKCTKQSYTPYVLSLQIIVQYSKFVAEGRQKIVDASFCWEFSVGFHLCRPVQRKMRKPLSHPPDWDIKKFFCISAGWGGCSAFSQRSDKKHSEAKHHWPGRGGPEGTGTVSRWRRLLKFDRFRR